MPYLQLDTPQNYSPEDKKLFARVMIETCAGLLKAETTDVHMAIRELGENNSWCMADGRLLAAFTLSCDLRDLHHTAGTRLDLAQALGRHCTEVLQIPLPQLKIIFTLHDRAEMYSPALGPVDPQWTMSAHSGGNN